MATSLQQLDRAEYDLLAALAQVRTARKKQAAMQPSGGDILRKAGSDPLCIDVAGRLFHRQIDGSYREVNRDPTGPIVIAGVGGGRAAAETEERAIKMLKRTAVLGHVLPRPVR
jgi:hypothetical protein